jgi:hypothetical protein
MNCAGTEVAVKVPKDEPANQSKILQLFRGEAQALSYGAALMMMMMIVPCSRRFQPPTARECVSLARLQHQSAPVLASIPALNAERISTD